MYNLTFKSLVTSDGKYNTTPEKRAIAALQCQRYGKLLLSHPFTVMDVMNLKIRLVFTIFHRCKLTDESAL